MTNWLHDEWCATFLDGAPESECDCVRRTLVDLEYQRDVLKAKLDKAEVLLGEAYQAMYGEYMGCPWCGGNIGYHDQIHSEDCVGNRFLIKDETES